MTQPSFVAKTVGMFRRYAGKINGKASKADNFDVFFEREWYLSQHDDVRDAIISPLQHYTQHGWREGRWPNRIFDPKWYRDRYADVAALDQDPLPHFIKHGRFEGRQPSAHFNPSEYARRHPELLKKNADPTEHYLSTQNADPWVVARDLSVRHSRMMKIGHERSPHNVLTMARETRAHLRTLDDCAVPWRDALLIKRVYGVEEHRRPVPDGLSAEYLELAAEMRRAAEARDELKPSGDAFVSLLEHDIQDEVAKAQRLEHALLKLDTLHRAERRS